MKKPEDKDLVVVHTAADNAEADIVKGLLEDNGIAAYIRGYHHRGLLGLLGPYISLDILVQKNLKTRADRLIREQTGSLERASQKQAVRRVPAKPKPLPTYFAVFLPFIFPGLCNFNSGNKKLGWLIGGGIIAIIAVTVWTAAVPDKDSLAMGFFFAGFFSLVFIDGVTGLLYRREGVKSHDNILFAVVLAVSALWFPSIWGMIEKNEAQKEIEGTDDRAPFAVWNFSFVNEKNEKRDYRPYRPGEGVSYRFTLYKNYTTRTFDSFSATVQVLIKREKDVAVIEMDRFDEENAPNPADFSGSFVLPASSAPGPYYLVLKINDKASQKETVHEAFFTVEGSGGAM